MGLGFRLVLVILLVALPAALLRDALAGERALLGVHTAQLEPWRGAGDTASIAALEAADLPLAADKTLMFQPQLEAANARLASGEAPLWNPHNLCGVPLLAQAVHGALHPPTWIAWALGPTRAFAWIALLQVALAGFFMHRLARELGLLDWPAAVAGFLFAFCGYFSVRWNWYQIQGASLYLPAALLGVERIFRVRETGGARSWGQASLSGVVWLAAAVGLSWLAGFPQGSLHLLYAAGALAAVRGAQAVFAGGRAGALRSCAAVAMAIVLGLGLGWPQLGPSLELAAGGESTRRAVAPELAATLAMPPAGLLGAALPGIWGSPQELAARHETPRLAERGALSRLLLGPGGNPVETACALGLGALLLAAAGAGSRRRGAGFAAALAVAGALLAIDTPLLPALLHLPGLSSGDPRRFLLLFCAGGALLAGFGLQRLLEGALPRGMARAAGALAAALAVLAAVAQLAGAEAWSAWLVPRLAEAMALPPAEVAAHSAGLAVDLELLRRALWTALAVAVAAALAFRAGASRDAERARRAGWLFSWACIAELLVFASGQVSLLPAEGHFAPPPGLAALLDDEGGRLARFTGGEPRAVLHYPLPPDTGLPFGVRDLSGYITLAPRRVERLHELLQPGTSFGVGTAALSDRAALGSPLLDLMAVSRVLSDVPLEAASGAPRAGGDGGSGAGEEGLTLVATIGSLRLYRNEGFRPRAWPAQEVLGVADEDAAAAALAHADGSARRRAVVEGLSADDAAALSAGGGPGEARFLRDDPEAIEIEVEAHGGPRLLVVADSWMPGWSATLDGAPVALRPANLAFRGVVVPEGRHLVRLAYGSPAWRAGLWTAPVSLAALLACALLARRASRAAAP